MAITYKNAALALTTSYELVYTCPTTDPPTTAVVLDVTVTNIHATNAADAYLQWTDASNADAVKRLAEAFLVPNKSGQELIRGPQILEADDKLYAKASAASALELTVAIAEKT